MGAATVKTAHPQVCLVLLRKLTGDCPMPLCLIKEDRFWGWLLCTWKCIHLWQRTGQLAYSNVLCFNITFYISHMVMNMYIGQFPSDRHVKHMLFSLSIYSASLSLLEITGINDTGGNNTLKEKMACVFSIRENFN